MSLAPAPSPLLCLDSRPGLPGGAAPAPAGPMGVGLSPQLGKSSHGWGRSGLAHLTGYLPTPIQPLWQRDEIR